MDEKSHDLCENLKMENAMSKHDLVKSILMIPVSLLVVGIMLFDIWYGEELFSDLWILYVPVLLFLFVLFIVTFAYAIWRLSDNHRSILNWISFAIFLIFLLFYILAPVNDIKNKLNFELYKDKRCEVVEMVKERLLEPEQNSRGVILPEGYESTSTGGDIVIYSNADEITIGFWILKGFLNSGYSMFIYSSSDDMNSIRKLWPDILETDIIERIENHWFYLNADRS
ncbi:ABC transporter permease [Blautia schinkii]|nr:ABC transporter permease [Blautia schinkii]